MNLFSRHKKNDESASQTDIYRGMNTQGKTCVHNIIIVDESGSMHSIERATVNGINETINSIKKIQEKHTDTQLHFLTLVTFSSMTSSETMRVIVDNKPIGDVASFSNYRPSGGTPLYDAVGTTLSRTHAMIKHNPNATGVVTIISDGMENSSRHWTANMVVKLIDSLTEEGWAFSYMGSDHDVRAVSMHLHITNSVEFSHDEKGAGNTWLRDASAKAAYYNMLSSPDYRSMSVANRRDARRRMSATMYRQRITPDKITQLAPNETLVFGSHVNGMHLNGLASVAVDRYGAIPGQPEGPQGQCYAIPTAGNTLTYIAESVNRFLAYTAKHPEQQFLVTAIGCGGAGFTPRAIAPLFRNAISLENVSLPHIFWELLGLRQ